MLLRQHFKANRYIPFIIPNIHGVLTKVMQKTAKCGPYASNFTLIENIPTKWSLSQKFVGVTNRKVNFIYYTMEDIKQYLKITVNHFKEILFTEFPKGAI